MAATCGAMLRTWISRRCAARWGSACAIVLRWARFASTSASSWTGGRCRQESAKDQRRCTFHSDRHFDADADKEEGREQREENAASTRRGFLLFALFPLPCQRRW